MEKVELKHDEELVLRCKNSKNLIVKKRYKSLEGPILVNVNCDTPNEITEPLTFKQAMVQGDMPAAPNASHIFAGVTRFLPPSHLEDGTLNPARVTALRQRSLEREEAIKNMSEEEKIQYYEKIANLEGDPRLEYAKKIGFYDTYTSALKVKEAKRKVREANRLAKEAKKEAERLKKEAKIAKLEAERLKKASLKKSKSNKSRGGRKKLRKKTKKKRPKRKKTKKKRKNKNNKTRKK